MMKKCAPARIVNVTSVVHSWGKIEFDNFAAERSFNKYKLYFNTKLANVLFTLELSKRLEGTGTCDHLFCLVIGTEARMLPFWARG